MSGYIAVTLREIVDRRAVLLAAVAAAMIPLLVPLLPANPTTTGEARDVTAWAVATLVTVGFGLLLGAGLLASDLVEGRIGFYLARPVSTVALWAGKLTGAVVLVLGAAAVVLAVPMALGPTDAPVGSGWSGVGWGLLGIAVAGVLCTTLGHVLAVMWRVRSRWLLLDLVAAVVVTAGLWWAAHLILSVYAEDLVPPLAIALLVVTLVSLVSAGALGLARGRGETNRTHRVLSTTLWSLLALAVATADAYGVWVASPTPADLEEIFSVRIAPTGGWVAVCGRPTGRGDIARACFLVDAESGRFLRMPMTRFGSPPIEFSPDGRHAVWWQYVGRDVTVVDLSVIDLESDPPSHRSLGLSIPWQWTGSLALDPGGNRMAMIADKTLTVQSTRGDALASVRLPEVATRAQRFNHLLWVAPDRVRLISSSTATLHQPGQADPHPWDLLIAELDLASGRLTTTGTYTSSTSLLRPQQLDLEDERLLVASTDGHTVLDARTAEPLSAVPGDDCSVRLLSSSGLAVACPEDGRWTLSVRDGDVPERSIDLGAPDHVYLGHEIAADVLAAGIGVCDDSERLHYDTEAIDLASGARRTVATDRAPAVPSPWHSLEPAPPGSAVGRLLYGDGVLEVFDPTTGDRRVLAGTARSGRTD